MSEPTPFEELARLVRVLAYNLSTTLGASPYMQALGDWMRAEPEENDLVIECSTVWYTNRNLDGVGYFIRHAHEDIPEWDDADEPNPGERVTYIRAFDGREVRWTNAMFSRAPKDLLTTMSGDPDRAGRQVRRPGVNAALQLATDNYRWRIAP